MGPNQTYKLLYSKESHKQNEKTTYRLRKKIFANNATNKSLTSKIYKHLINNNNKTTQLENGQNT